MIREATLRILGISRAIGFLISIQFVSMSSFAQETFEQGIIVTKDNKTVHGLLKLQLAEPASFGCVFKESETGKPVYFSPKEVREFRFESGRKFLSNQFDLKIDTTNEQFVEQLVSGGANLYFAKGIYYLIKIDNVPVILNWENVSDKTNKARGPGIHFLLSDCMKFKINQKEVKYTHANLIYLVKNYNESCYSYETNVHYSEAYKTGIWVGISGGTNIYSVKSSNKEVLNSPPALVFGGAIRILLPSSQNKYSLNFGLQYTTQTYVANSIINYDEATTIYREYSFDNSYLKLNTNLDFNVFDKKLRIDLSGGVFYYSPIAYNTSVISEAYTNSVIETTTDTITEAPIFGSEFSALAYYQFKNNQIVGLRFKYELGIINSNSLRTSIYSLQLNYSLKIK